LLVVIFASLLFQMGTDFWARTAPADDGEYRGDRPPGLHSGARPVDRETVTMASDIAGYLAQVKLDDPEFINAFANQVLVRNLSEAVLFSVAADGEIRSLGAGRSLRPSAAEDIRRPRSRRARGKQASQRQQ
jgi:two-component system nitrogen regulation sensor histidine kinase NtrY